MATEWTPALHQSILTSGFQLELAPSVHVSERFSFDVGELGFLGFIWRHFSHETRQAGIPIAATPPIQASWPWAADMSL
jgi:hypothetical protein